ncbi:hypothetical protein ACMX9J_02145 [Priestia sp. RMT2NF4]|uniref:hypothetical protein n=1 Tax=Priestia sp. RMT2NF4 TaxID=3398394 RepID=UPI003A4C52E2
MDFPTIHTNFWDAVIGVPVVLIVTQLIKWLFHPKKQYVPTIALAVGVLFSVFISHPHHIIAGLFMGYFYGYAAIGSYAGLKTTWRTIRKDTAPYSSD